MRKNTRPVLLGVTLLNYAAQVPYYLHNYYFPYHELPTASSVILLGGTLLWFLVGYFGFCSDWTPGFYMLVSFLLFEALFYLHSFVFGAFFFQLKNPSIVIKSVFVYGYLSGAVAAWYAYALIRYRELPRLN